MIIGRCYNHWYAKGGFGVHHEVPGGPGCVRGDSLWHIFTLRENLILQYLTEEWTVYEH